MLTPLLWLKFFEGNAGNTAVEYMEQTGDMSGVSLLAAGKGIRALICMVWIFVAIYYVVILVITIVSVGAAYGLTRSMYH